MAKHDKTEAPTPKKKRDARKKGQIAKSHDLVGWVQLFVMTSVARGVVGGVGTAVRGTFDAVGRVAAHPDERAVVPLLGSGLADGMLALAPALGLLLVIVLLGNMAQTGLAFASQGFKPKFERMNPVKGLKRMVSVRTGWELGKVLAKLFVLTGVAVPATLQLSRTVVLMGQPSVATLVSTTAAGGLRIVRNTALAGIVLAGVDYAFQRRTLLGTLRMTKQEIKDEVKQQEGDPHLKGEVRARAMAISRNRMMAEVGMASAVIVNPTHYAVAIRYRPGDVAPVVVAKGRGAVALRIREEAERHRVPIHRDVPLCRALHAACELGDIVPVELYAAVAKVLALVMSLGRKGLVGR